MEITIKTNREELKSKKHLIRFMGAYARLWDVLESARKSYELATILLDCVMNKQDDIFDFNFECLCGTITRVGEDSFELCEELDYYDEHNNLLGTYEVVL